MQGPALGEGDRQRHSDGEESAHVFVVSSGDVTDNLSIARGSSRAGRTWATVYWLDTATGDRHQRRDQIAAKVNAGDREGDADKVRPAATYWW